MVGSIVGYYADGKYRYVIENSRNGFWIHYGFDPVRNSSDCWAGPFKTGEESEEILKKHRPGAVKYNNMCARCMADCGGTRSDVWTGCVYRISPKTVCLKAV